MQIDTQPLQVNARRINVPRVIYGAGDSAVRLSILNINRMRLPDPVSRMYETAVGMWSENSSIHLKYSTPGLSLISLVIKFRSTKLEIECVRCPCVASN